jgi:hypothetical protein
MSFDGDFDRFDPRGRRPGDGAPRGREDEYIHPFAPQSFGQASPGRRPASMPQADGDPGAGAPRAGKRPPGSYGELNYRDEDSPRGIPQPQTAGRFRGRGPKGFRRSDERLREDASEALARHGDVDASEIELRVAEGEVTLDGTVPDRRTKWLAEDCVLAVSGVRDVQNNLRIVDSQGRSRGSGKEHS